MTDAAQSDREVRQTSDLVVFAIKLLMVVIAFFVCCLILNKMISNEINKRSAMLKPGPEFWGSIEGRLYKLADEPDIPDEQKAKVIAALRKLSVKYAPYIEAFSGNATKR